MSQETMLPERPAADRGRIHPYSAGLLIFIDNVFFGANAITLGFGTPVMAFLAFVLTGTGVFLTQRFLVEESTGVSLARAFLLAVLAGVPTSVLGSGAGMALLVRSGLGRLLRK